MKPFTYEETVPITNVLIATTHLILGVSKLCTFYQGFIKRGKRDGGSPPPFENPPPPPFKSAHVS